ncbi:hypothetical protein H310_06805 [Aphanomyces invadans]|uniref:Carbohydrate-binding domain-containing protein n=1 Tax=Aphanomyces invadans TaxID=157072 RepID=A0A024U469_9STRA|nr:hypothetical protein H310_06805 [Aphanomyces invadans]ETW01216.1 hypothetical protein H310_06805 [Aphanomyces invadans]|eukprot:XP_008870214.1 hypothetical protein H310_06805 [Aphanomyces invadans]
MQSVDGNGHRVHEGQSCKFAAHHPLSYAVYHLHPSEHVHIDGKLEEDAWTAAQWTAPFTDIIGPKHWSQPWFETRVKMRYDDTFLYVGAYIQDTDVWATLTKRNSVVFTDNDFEIFVDPVGTTHNYKEFEVNALNTTWNLFLNKPYRDGGAENSTRVDPVHGFDMLPWGLRSAVYTKGRVNDPNQHVHYWTVEVALPLAALAWNTTAVVPPMLGSSWRINFSRVEWTVEVKNGRYEKTKNLPEDNWVWSPQGDVAMHKPEMWGYLDFVQQNDSPVALKEDLEFPARYQAFAIYYAQKAFLAQYNRYADTLDDLLPWIADKDVLSCLHVVYMSATADRFHAGTLAFGYTAHIRYDSFIYVTTASSGAAALA